MDKRYKYLTSAFVNIIEKCNLRCEYCFEKALKYNGPKMTVETLHNVIDFLYSEAQRARVELPDADEYEPVHVTLFGGEPLLAPDLIIEAVRYGKEKEKELNIPFVASLITNGTIWNDKVEEALNYWLNVQGFINIQLSYDGAPIVQDNSRKCADGSCSSEAIKSAFKHYSEYAHTHKDVLFTIHSMITKSSLPYMYDSYVYFAEELGIVDMPIQFNWVMEDAFSGDDYKTLEFELTRVEAYMLSHPEIIVNLARIYRNNFTWMCYPIVSACGPVFCGAGRTRCGINATGNIYACHRFNYIKDEKFAEEHKDLYHSKNGELNVGYLGNVNHNPCILRPDFKTWCDELKADEVCDYPCQICIAANYDTYGDMTQMVNTAWFKEVNKIIMKHRMFFERQANKIIEQYKNN